MSSDVLESQQNNQGFSFKFMLMISTNTMWFEFFPHECPVSLETVYTTHSGKKNKKKQEEFDFGRLRWKL